MKDQYKENTLIRGYDGFVHAKVGKNWVLLADSNFSHLSDFSSIQEPVTVLYDPSLVDDDDEDQSLPPLSIFEQAEKLINGERADDYGDKEENFTRIAALWGAYTGDVFSPKDVAIMMMLLKISRLANTPNHFDSWLDVIGYAGIGSELR